MYLLDTCFLSEIKKKKPQPEVMDAYQALKANEIFISVITLGEIATGIDSLADLPRKQELFSWMHGLKQQFSQSILAVDLPVMERWAKLNTVLRRQGLTLPGFDGLIAATALANSLTIITRNVRHFQNTGVAIYNPWQESRL